MGSMTKRIKAFTVLRWLAALLLLPINVLIIIPAILFDLEITDLNYWTIWLSIAIGLPGLVLAISCVRLFATLGGGGTPAPWDPIGNLIIIGPYRYVRNPMLSGVIIMLFSEALFFRSLPFLFYAILFTVINMVYFPLIEEPGLIKRYGNTYKDYMKNVPRWIPAAKPYNHE